MRTVKTKDYILIGLCATISILWVFTIVLFEVYKSGRKAGMVDLAERRYVAEQYANESGTFWKFSKK